MGSKSIFASSQRALKSTNLRGLSKNPLFYFAFCAVFLFGAICASCDNSSNINGLNNSRFVFFNSFLNSNNINTDNLFSSQAEAAPLETPELKIIQNNTVFGISTPQIVSGKVLGDVFGGSSKDNKEISDYAVQPGDTLQSIADSNNISVNTLAWANGLTSSSTVKVGQIITILPTDGILHVVKSGDTISGIAQTYKSKTDDIVAFNTLANQADIYIGDVLVVPGGVMPKKVNPAIDIRVQLASDFFIYPTQGYIAQGLHYYNAVDIANKCGTPIYAAAAGVVQRAVGNGQYNQGMGNHITISHSNGITTYYGHLMSIMPGIVSGAPVYKGQPIALMGGKPGMAGAGKSTACHVHLQVMGATNPLGKYPVGTKVGY